MKKILAAVVFCLTTSLFALPNPEEYSWNLSIEPFFGLRNGLLQEYVFYKNSKVSSDKLSQLDWDIENLLLCGAKVSGGWKNINASISYGQAIPSSSGDMEDFDWKNIEYSSNEDYNYLTNYTKSDNYVDQSYFFEASLGYTFNPHPQIKIAPFAGYDYSYINFKAKGMSGSYGNFDSTIGCLSSLNSDNSYTVYADSSTTVITYERFTEILWLGTSVDLTLKHNLFANLTLQIAPLVKTVSYDHHVVKGYYYADEGKDYFSAIKASLSFGYILNQNFSFLLTGTCLVTDLLRGNTYQSYDEGSTYKIDSNYEGGAAQTTFDLTASVRFTIF